MTEQNNFPNLPRLNTYIAIDSERDFQDKMSASPHRPDMVENMSLGDILGAISVNIDKAKHAWYRDSAPYANTMTYLRKVAALSVKAGERFGMPVRGIETSFPANVDGSPEFNKANELC